MQAVNINYTEYKQNPRSCLYTVYGDMFELCIVVLYRELTCIQIESDFFYHFHQRHLALAVTLFAESTSSTFFISSFLLSVPVFQDVGQGEVADGQPNGDRHRSH